VTERSTATTVSCETPRAMNQGSLCTVTVTDTDAGTPSAPTGSVDFTRSGVGSGTFSAASCALGTPIGSSSSCSVTYTPTAGAGTHTVAGTYNEGSSGLHATSNDSFDIDAYLRATETTVVCSPMSVQLGSPTTCTATVKDIELVGAPSDPAGNVTFTSSGLGTFASTTCTLVPDGNASTFTSHCSVTYTPSTTGTPTITAQYEGSDVHAPSADLVILSVFDPTGGFVTGGGWIMSPVGACVSTDGSICSNTLAAGKANFGFNARYKPGASTPTGQTEFQFKAGNLNFHSTTYDVLIVTANCKAQFRGTGTINGVSGYRFVLTAYDAESGGGGQCAGKTKDSFRIRITKIGSGTVVYDNKFGNASDPEDIELADPQQIDGGSIVIHR
jgi:hypothetical protein